MKKWIKNNCLIIIWAIASIVFAIIVHYLFSVPAPVKWLSARWSAGEILTYVSTVSLGLLAVWQNKKFQAENDKSQERLERLTKQSNELAVVSKIIDYESTNLQRLKTAVDDFLADSDPERIAIKLATINELNEANFAASLLDNKSDMYSHFGLLCRELRIDKDIRNDDQSPLPPLLMNALTLYNTACKFFETWGKTRSFSDIPEKELKYLREARDEFSKAIEKYLIQRENLLNELVCGNLSIEEIQTKLRLSK